jgi:hypothetical protein
LPRLLQIGIAARICDDLVALKTVEILGLCNEGLLELDFIELLALGYNLLRLLGHHAKSASYLL